VAHGAGDLDDLVEGDRLGVLDVLLLLAVTGRLLKGLDDEGRGGGNDGDGSLTVLDAELDGDTESFLYGELDIEISPYLEFGVTYPVSSGLGDIFTDLLGRQTKGTDLGGKSGGGSDFTTSGTEVAIEPENIPNC
jgi:hypothetical protein